MNAQAPLRILNAKDSSYHSADDKSFPQELMDHNRDLLVAQAKIFKALGHPNRLLMAQALHKKPLCVCELHALVGGDISTVSRHLRVLHEAGIVSATRQGTNMQYCLTMPCLTTFLHCSKETLRARAQHDLQTCLKS